MAEIFLRCVLRVRVRRTSSAKPVLLAAKARSSRDRYGVSPFFLGKGAHSFYFGKKERGEAARVQGCTCNRWPLLPWPQRAGQGAPAISAGTRGLSRAAERLLRVVSNFSGGQALCALGSRAAFPRQRGALLSDVLSRKGAELRYGQPDSSIDILPAASADVDSSRGRVTSVQGDRCSFPGGLEYMINGVRASLARDTNVPRASVPPAAPRSFSPGGLSYDSLQVAMGDISTDSGGDWADALTAAPVAPVSNRNVGVGCRVALDSGLQKKHL